MKKKNTTDESYLFDIGTTICWWSKSTKGKVFYKGVVIGYLDPEKDTPPHQAKNLMRYLTKVEYQVSTVKDRVVCSFKDPTRPAGEFHRKPRRSLVNSQHFSSEESMAEEVRAVYDVALSDLKEGAEELFEYSDKGGVVLIDLQEKKEQVFPTLKAIAQHLNLRDRELLYIAKTLWIDRRYQIRYQEPDKHQSIGFRRIKSGKRYKDILDGWKDSLFTDPNAFYRAAVAAALAQTYEFEAESHRYRLVDEDGNDLVSELFPDIHPADTDVVKIAKIRQKARELSERPNYTISPWAIALNVQSHYPHLLPYTNGKNWIVEYLYQYPYEETRSPQC